MCRELKNDIEAKNQFPLKTQKRIHFQKANLRVSQTHICGTKFLPVFCILSYWKPFHQHFQKSGKFVLVYLGH